jgi:hypothetical protein
MKGPTKRKCLCCRNFYDPDPRNLRHQRYCSKPTCRKQSKAQSQRQWQQKPENQNYFRSPENSQRVKEWRKRNPGYRRKKKVRVQGVLQEVFQAQVTHNEEIISERGGNVLQDLFSMQPTVVVGLALHDDRQCVTRRHCLHCRGVGTQRTGHPGHQPGGPKRPALTMKTKRLLCPQRLRTVPHQFSWIDQRLVREGHIARCGGTQALALYLLLVTVADSQGLSYYSDKTAARLLCISEEQLRHARLGLLQAGLIAYEAPLYQVLSLEPVLSAEQPAPRTGQTLPLSAILRQMMESSGKPPQP